MPQLPRRAQGGESVKEGYTRGGAANGADGIRVKCRRWRGGGGEKRKGEDAGLLCPETGKLPGPYSASEKENHGAFPISERSDRWPTHYLLAPRGQKEKNQEAPSLSDVLFLKPAPHPPLPFKLRPIFLLPLLPPPARSEQADDPPGGKVDVHVVKARARGKSGDGHDVSRQRVQEACPDTGSDLADGDFEARGDAWGGGARA